MKQLDLYPFVYTAYVRTYQSQPFRLTILSVIDHLNNNGIAPDWLISWAKHNSDSPSGRYVLSKLRSNPRI